MAAQPLIPSRTGDPEFCFHNADQATDGVAGSPFLPEPTAAQDHRPDDDDAVFKR